MKIYPMHDDKGRLHSFEVENWKLSKARAKKIAAAIPGARTTNESDSKADYDSDGTFFEFNVGEEVFQIDEPFGDNSRYLISKKESGWCPELELVKFAFEQAW